MRTLAGFVAGTARRLVVVGVIVAVLATAFACGHPSEDNQRIHVALSAPLTGEWAEYGIGFRQAVELAVEELNASGGVLGRDVRVSVGDTKGDVEEARALAERWSSDPSVVAQIGPFSSETAFAMQPVFDAGGLLQVSPTASHREFAGGSRWSFNIVGTQSGVGRSLAEFARHDLELERVGVLFLDNAWGQDAAESFSAEFEPLSGEVVGRFSYGSGEREFVPQLSELRDRGAQALFLAAFYNDGAVISIQRQELGWDVPVFGPSSLYATQLIELAGSAVDGLYTEVSFFGETDEPHAQRFVEEYQRRYNRAPIFHAALAYDAMMVIADAIERAGGADREAIRDALAATEDAPGVTGLVTFTERGEAVKDYTLLQIRNREFQPVPRRP